MNTRSLQALGRLKIGKVRYNLSLIVKLHFCLPDKQTDQPPISCCILNIALLLTMQSPSNVAP